ncbi:hypothetical protein T07_11132, partial [Trichinella nelsoni]
LMLYNPTPLSKSCKGYHRLLIYVLNIYPLHAVRIYSILRYFYAVLDCASMKANILQVQLSSLGQASGITGPVLPETNLLFTVPPFRSS